MLLETSVDTGTAPPQLAADRRLCRPSKGRSLGATVVAFAKPVHLAVQRLVKNPNSSIESNALFEFLTSRETIGAIPESSAERLAWFTVNVGLLHAVCHKTIHVFPLRDAISWFFHGYDEYAFGLVNSFDQGSIDYVDALLSQLLVDESFLDLLPYILEPHGHVTRGSLERSAVAAQTRNRKRDAGVYYTPSDVAEFMVGGLVDGDPCRTWIDPACGTAVFLREALRAFARRAKLHQSALEYCKTFIYGLDISPLATESGAFVLLIECARRETIGRPSAFDAWRLIAGNIHPCDATSLHFGGGSPSLFETADEVNCIPIARLFPNTGGAFDRVIVNPPYSALPINKARKTSWASFQDLPLGAKANAAAAFVEMMWQLAKSNGSASAVVPLSIGASSHRQYKACRRAIKRSGGAWEFLFFDREPHALFGEDIKTRNVIIFRRGSSTPVELHTSRMLKWTSALRPAIFTRGRTTRIADDDIEEFIPKLGTDIEARLYEALQELPKVTRLPFDLTRTTLADVARLDSERAVIVGSSAYNFLNAFLPSSLEDAAKTNLSASPLHVLLFETKEHRDVGYSVLVSTLAFWLWHTEGDGFHVTADFLTRLPLWREAFFSRHSSQLSELGRAAWNKAAQTRVKSINGGKTTYSFHCSFDSTLVKDIDRMLLSYLGLKEQFDIALAAFIAETVSIDGTKRRRTMLQLQP